MSKINEVQYRTEIPSLPLMVFHMDVDSPRGIDAVFNAESLRAQARGNYVRARSFNRTYDMKKYDLSVTTDAVREWVCDNLEEGYHENYNSELRQLVIYRFCAAYPDQLEFMLSIRTDHSFTNFYVAAMGSVEKIISLEKHIDESLSTRDARMYDIGNVLAVDAEGRASVNTVTLKYEELDYPHIEFYPQIMEMGYTDIDDFVDDYMASEFPLLMLLGERGAAKTTLAAYIAFRAKGDYRYMIQHEAPLISQGFGNWLIGLPPGSLVALEDSHNSITNGNENIHMSALRNYTSGVGSKRNKLLVTSNIDSLSQVDTPLKREGRVFKIINFGKLSPEQASAARHKLGLPAVEFDRPVTVAEAIHHGHVTTVGIKDSGRVGFM